MPFKPQKIKSLFIIFRIHALNIIYARGKPRAKHYFSRHVQDFFKKKIRRGMCKK
jgi:hypothetical protein